MKRIDPRTQNVTKPQIKALAALQAADDNTFHTPRDLAVTPAALSALVRKNYAEPRPMQRGVYGNAYRITPAGRNYAAALAEAGRL